VVLFLLPPFVLLLLRFLEEEDAPPPNPAMERTVWVVEVVCVEWRNGVVVAIGWRKEDTGVVVVERRRGIIACFIVLFLLVS